MNVTDGRHVLTTRNWLEARLALLRHREKEIQREIQITAAALAAAEKADRELPK